MTAAGRRYAYAQYVVTARYDSGQGVVQNEVEAIRWYKLASDQGWTPAQLALANYYLKSKGMNEQQEVMA